MIVGIAFPEREPMLFDCVSDDLSFSVIVPLPRKDSMSLRAFIELLATSPCDVIVLPTIAAAEDWDVWLHDLYRAMPPPLREKVRIVGPDDTHCVEWPEAPRKHIWSLRAASYHLARYPVQPEA